MVDRNLYNEIIEELKQIYSHHSGLELDTSIKHIEDVKEHFDIKLMVVGHFSAGKSTLLNSLIGRNNFLKEAQEPQTAIATELKYDEVESALVFSTNGHAETFDFEKEYMTNQYEHIEFRLNSNVLKELRDFTIVDTPGFDAGIEAHTKALTNYIGFGSAYLVVIDQEKGGIDQVTLDFIKELSNYSSQIAVLINKCDKITEDIAESIAESAKLTLLMNGLPYKVYTISKRDADITDKLKSIILSFNAQLAFNKVMLQQIKTELFNAEKILSATKNKLYLDTYDLDIAIDKYSRLEEKLTNSFEQKRVEADEDIENTVNDVIALIKEVLMSRSDSVAEAMLSGNQIAAEAIILETIRPLMMSSMKSISSKQIDNITEALDFTGIVNEAESVDLANVALNLAGNIKSLIDQGMFDSKTVTDVENSDKKKNIYRALTGIAAIATNVVAPWLEIVIILAPDIISLLQGVFGESSVDLAKRRYVNNVVPQIINKLFPQVKENVETTTCLVINEYEKMMKNKIESIKNNLITAQNMKKKKIEDYENYKAVISEDIDIIKRIHKELR